MLLDTATVLAESTLTFSEKMATAFELLLLGMGVVFAALIIIWIVLAIVGRIFKGLGENQPEKPAEDETVGETPVTETSEAVQPQGELVAVIAATIGAYTDKPLGSFRVVSFKER